MSQLEHYQKLCDDRGLGLFSESAVPTAHNIIVQMRPGYVYRTMGKNGTVDYQCGFDNRFLEAAYKDRLGLAEWWALEIVPDPTWSDQKVKDELWIAELSYLDGLKDKDLGNDVGYIMKWHKGPWRALFLDERVRLRRVVQAVREFRDPKL